MPERKEKVVVMEDGTGGFLGLVINQEQKEDLCYWVVPWREGTVFSDFKEVIKTLLSLKEKDLVSGIVWAIDPQNYDDEMNLIKEEG